MGVDATNLPSRRTVTRSATAKISPMRWLTYTIVSPSRASWRAISRRRSASATERELVGSSKTMRRGACDAPARSSRLAAIWQIWRRPGLRRPRGASTSMAGSSTCTRRAARSRIARKSTTEAPPRDDPTRTGMSCRQRFSATLRLGHCASSWWTRRMPASNASSRSPGIRTRPSIVTVPESCRCSPAMHLPSVLLPAPFSPIRAWTSPRSNVTETSARAWV